MIQGETLKAAIALQDALGDSIGGGRPINSGRHVYSHWDVITSKVGGHHKDWDCFKHPKNKKIKTNYRQKLKQADDFLARPARLYPGKTAIVDGKLRFTYGEYQKRVNQLANTLLARGIGKGDRVCILSPNSHFFLESFYATARIGAILVPRMPIRPPGRVAHCRSPHGAQDNLCGPSAGRSGIPGPGR